MICAQVNKLTLEEQIGQTFMVGFQGTRPSPELIELIQQRHVGNIILFTRNIKDTAQLYELTKELQEIARQSGQNQPLLIAIDQENGIVQRLGTDATHFPGNMVLGAVGSPQSAYEVALASGQELRAAGINLNLAPVVDINNNPVNPVIGIRSFGDDPRQVALLANAEIRGYQEAGIATCIKHFPGHGDTATDSHLMLPALLHSMERLEALELVPFKEGIAAGVDCVMTAHLHLAALEQDPTIPATLSSAVIRLFLRQKLHFQGVIITDCLEMNAISQGFGVGKGAVLASRAGNDLLLISHRLDRQREALDEVTNAVTKNSLSRQEIAESAGRVLALKQHLYERSRSIKTPDLVGEQPHQQLSRQIYERSTTVVRDRDHLLPIALKSEQSLLTIFTSRKPWTPAEDRDYPEHTLVESLRLRHAHTRFWPLTEKTDAAEYEELYSAARQADRVLLVTLNAIMDPRQVTVMQRLLALEIPVIGLAVHLPYDLLAFPELGTYMVTYEYTKPAIAAAIKVLFGEIQPLGQLPIKLFR